MKRLLLYLLTIASIVAIAVCCEKSDNGDPDRPDPNTPVPDPDGTITLSMRNANSGKTYLGNTYIYIDKADNFTNGYFVSFGKVNGLGNVIRIPESGWSDTIAVIPGEGYVAYSGGTFYRIYVTNYTTNIANEIIGADIKYQAPFVGYGNIVLPKQSVTFDSKGGSETLKFGSDIIPFSAKVVSDGNGNTQSAKCTVSITHVEKYSFLPNGITITAGANTDTNDVKHKVVITTADGRESEIGVTVKSAAPYISFDGEEPAIALPASNEAATSFSILTNLAPEDIQIKNDSWTEVSQTSASKDGRISYSVKCQENATGKERKGTITVYTDKHQNISTEITVSQKPHTFELSSDSVYLDRIQQNTSITLTTTANEFSAKSDSESWCTLSCNKNVITVRATANDTSKNRTANIVVKLNDGQSKNIAVHQGRYTAGDSYEANGVKGVVFETYYENGFHGKIISLDEAQKAWSTENVATGATDRNDGRKNMEIIKAIPNWETLYPAFAWCADHGSGWYLPSCNEFAIIYSIRSILNMSSTDYYWTSTESGDARGAWCYYNYNSYCSKITASNVRAIYVF